MYYILIIKLRFLSAKLTYVRTFDIFSMNFATNVLNPGRSRVTHGELQNIELSQSLN